MLQYRAGRRLTAFFLGFIILLAMLGAELYITEHIMHKCSGEHCPICYEIQIADKHIQQISSGIISFFLITFVAIVLKKESVAASDYIPTHSLINEKIRLND